ncbi:protein of unknown function [Clostridium beijerinckii]|nr:protein of unknown function [Clostridium beijerinckii]
MLYQPSYPFLLHLTPGTRRIDVKATDPNYMSSSIKDDFINITIPTAITTSAVTVK